MRLYGERADRALSRIVTALAAMIALSVTLMLPAAYYLSAYTTLHAEIAAEARLAATTVSQVASSNPELWTFENARVRGMLSMFGALPDGEWRVVMSGKGDVVAEQGTDPPWPSIDVTSPVYDAGAVIGEVIVERSQRQMLITTAVIALIAGSLGAAAFLVLRSVPLRLLHGALARATHLATHDTLTGLPNRALFTDRVAQALAWSRREGDQLAVLYLDLDRFKEVNDTLGHAAGDRLLIAVAGRLRTCVRDTDTLGRLGGDEFAIVQVGIRQFGDVELLAQRLVSALDWPLDIDGAQVTVGVSIGIAMRDMTDPAQSHTEVGALLQEADVALYRAKDEGRATYRFFAAEMNRRLRERRALEAAMQEALEQGQFRVHFQPQLDLAERRIVGAEALIRWHHPVRGDISPEAFIPLAEESGLIVRIGEWVLREACRQAALWPGLRCMAVNVSPAQFRRPGFFDQVQQVLRETGLEPARLEIEITEGVLLNETAETLATLHRLRGLGVAIAMDDFGTGYSSLGYLQKFHFDKIKIDRSFVTGLATDAHAAAIVRAVVRMSHAMGISVIAEGVEQERQANLLEAEGCEEVQGFLFGRALPPAEFAAMLARAVPQRPLCEDAAALT